jgi:hypothetical protein
VANKGVSMCLNTLNNGYTFGTKMLFAFIHLVSRWPVPDAARLALYRPDFYGAPMGTLTHLAMRGPSAWSVGDRELMTCSAVWVGLVGKMALGDACLVDHESKPNKSAKDRNHSDPTMLLRCRSPKFASPCKIHPLTIPVQGELLPDGLRVQ